MGVSGSGAVIIRVDPTAGPPRSGAVVVAGVEVTRAVWNHWNLMAEDKAQQLYADVNYEYPMKAGVAVNATIADPNGSGGIINND